MCFTQRREEIIAVQHDNIPVKIPKNQENAYSYVENDALAHSTRIYSISSVINELYYKLD